MSNNYSVKITRREVLRVDMFNWTWYKITGRILNADGTRYRRFKFVVDFDDADIMDACELSDADVFGSKWQNIKRDYLDDYIFSYVDMIRSYDDVQDFYNACSASITRYNEHIKGSRRGW